MIQPSPRLNMLLLLGFNIYLIIYYYQHPDRYGNLLLLYWFQSVIIGLFSWLGLIALHRQQQRGTDPTRKKEGLFTIFFFPVHFGGFHLVYLLFIVIQYKIFYPGTWLLLSVLIMFINELLDFRHKLVAIRSGRVSAGAQFFLPYMRILPMHLALLGASFSFLGSRGLFLMLKTLADIGMYSITNRIFFASPKQQNG